MNLSDDSFALFLLCSHLGLPEDADAKPFSGREWNELERKLAANSISISHLLGSSAELLKSSLQTDDDEAARLAWLLDRSSALEQELHRLADLGIWVITRFDEEFPQKLTQRLKGAASVMLYGSGDARLLNRRGHRVVGSRRVELREFAWTECTCDGCVAARTTGYSCGGRGVYMTA